LHWCHQRGVAHRDVKPQNLLLSHTGVLKIADFGLAASFNPDPALRVSACSLRQTMCGSPLYMAPEMLSLRSGASYNALATDTWGCGAVLYTMLFGEPPFPASSFSELVNLASRPQVHLRLPDTLPRELSALIRAMLRLDPKQRYTLPQVARSSWFQQGLAATLSNTPEFRPPDGMGPVAVAHRGARLSSSVSTRDTLAAKSVPSLDVQVRGLAPRSVWKRSPCRLLFAPRRARVDTGPTTAKTSA
jgi:serine/threonine-protein kinase Chk1